MEAAGATKYLLWHDSAQAVSSYNAKLRTHVVAEPDVRNVLMPVRTMIAPTRRYRNMLAQTQLRTVTVQIPQAAAMSRSRGDGRRVGCQGHGS